MTFCSTVICAHRLNCWNTMDSRERSRSSCLGFAQARDFLPSTISMSSPLTETRPLSGISNILIQRRKVLLPEPEAPRIAITSCSLAVTETPFSTSSGPNDLWISSTTRAGIGVMFSGMMAGVLVFLSRHENGHENQLCKSCALMQKGASLFGRRREWARLVRRSPPKAQPAPGTAQAQRAAFRDRALWKAGGHAIAPT